MIGDWNGVFRDFEFQPFGKRRKADWSSEGGASPSSDLDQYTQNGFTGHEHLDGGSLIHMKGRVYDPEVGAFLQPDLFIPHPASSQSFNRYSYVRNDPLSVADPTGFYEGCPNCFSGSGLDSGSGLATYFFGGGLEFGPGVSVHIGRDIAVGPPFSRASATQLSAPRPYRILRRW